MSKKEMISKVEDLANEALNNGFPEAAIILNCLCGAMIANADLLFAEKVVIIIKDHLMPLVDQGIELRKISKN